MHEAIYCVITSTCDLIHQEAFPDLDCQLTSCGEPKVCASLKLNVRKIRCFHIFVVAWQFLWWYWLVNSGFHTLAILEQIHQLRGKNINVCFLSLLFSSFLHPFLPSFFSILLQTSYSCRSPASTFNTPTHKCSRSS
jgi:hypothetical protein